MLLMALSFEILKNMVVVNIHVFLLFLFFSLKYDGTNFGLHQQKVCGGNGDIF